MPSSRPYSTQGLTGRTGRHGCCLSLSLSNDVCLRPLLTLIRRNDNGGFLLIDMAHNPISVPSWFELVCGGGLSCKRGKNDREDLNALRLPRNLKWKTIDFAMRSVCALRISRSSLAMDMAHDNGGTPLSAASRNGNVKVVRWLLKNGAFKSLHLKTKNGCSPLELCRIFGPHREVSFVELFAQFVNVAGECLPCCFLFQVARELGSIILDGSFAVKLARSKGRQMLDSPSNLDPGIAEAKHGDAIITNPSQALRPPEPAGRTLAAENPSVLHNHPATVESVHGVAEAKTEENGMQENGMQLAEAPPPSRAMVDAPPELPCTDSDSVAASKQLDASAQTPLIDPSHEYVPAVQIDALHIALKAFMCAANMAMKETIQEENQRRQDSMQAMNMAMKETMQEAHQRQQIRSEILEAKLETFMASVTERLGAIENVVSERHGVH